MYLFLLLDSLSKGEKLLNETISVILVATRDALFSQTLQLQTIMCFQVLETDVIVFTSEHVS